ncbi:MAG: HpcH/HpaI aldolase/citrate lyase family protein [Anaerotignum sp.]
MKNRVLEKFRNQQPSYGTFTHLKSMTVIEALGAAGLDYVVIDMEHSPTGITEVTNYITAADAAGITPFVRVDEASRSAVLHALDVGAKGIVVPCIESVEQVKQLVEYAKFGPVGNRGYCMTRDGQWGFGASYEDGMAGYMTISNRDTWVIPQCETMGCLESIEEIIQLDGVDGVMVGPYDLSIAMGIPGQFAEESFQGALERILSAAKAAGKPAFIFTGNAADTKLRIAQGFDSAMVSIDILMLVNAYKALLHEIKAGE